MTFVDIDTYLVLKLAGILWFSLACLWHLRRYKLSPASRVGFVAFIVLSGFLGSKIWYLIQHLLGNEPYAFDDPVEAWNFAGSVLYGWIFGGCAATWLGAVLLKLPVKPLLDAFLPHMLFAQILNRLGCFAADCCWGKGPCALPWSILSESAGNIHVHPVQIYEALLDGALLVLLWTKGRRAPEGWTTRTYFLGYAAYRFTLEFWRGDNGPALGGMTVPQVTSLIIIVFILFTYRRRKVA